MWRALFLAIGMSLLILGGECVIIHEAAWQAETGITQISPEDWMPWAFCGAGAVVVLYCFSIPRRVSH